MTQLRSVHDDYGATLIIDDGQCSFRVTYDQLTNFLSIDASDSDRDQKYGLQLPFVEAVDIILKAIDSWQREEVKKTK